MAFAQLNEGVHFDGSVQGVLDPNVASSPAGAILLTLAPTTPWADWSSMPDVTVFSTDTFQIVMDVIEGGQNAPRVQFTASTHDPNGPTVQTISTNSNDAATGNEEITIALRYDNTTGAEVFELSLASRKGSMGDNTEHVSADNGVAWSSATGAGSSAFAENFEGFISQVVFFDGTATSAAISGMVLDPNSVSSTDPSVVALYDFTSLQDISTVSDTSLSAGTDFAFLSTSDGSPVPMTTVDYWAPRNATVVLSDSLAPEGGSITATVTIDAPAGPDGHAARLELTGTATAESDHGALLRLSNGTEATINIGTDQELQDVVDGGDAYYLVLKSTNYVEMGYPSNVYSLTDDTVNTHAYSLMKVAKTDGSTVTDFGDGGSMVLPFVGNWQQDPAQLLVDQTTGKLLFSALQNSPSSPFPSGVNVYNSVTGEFESNIPISYSIMNTSTDTLLGAADGVLFYSEWGGSWTLPNPGNLFVIDQSTGSVIVEAVGVLPDSIQYHHVFNDGSMYSSDANRRYVEESYGVISTGTGSPLFAFSRANVDETSDLVWVDITGESHSVAVPDAGGKFTDTGYVVKDGESLRVFDWSANGTASSPTDSTLTMPTIDLTSYGTLVGTDLLTVGQDGQSVYLSTEVSSGNQSRYLVQKLDILEGSLTLDTSFGESGVFETGVSLVDRAGFQEASSSTSNGEIHVVGDGSGLASFEGIDLYNQDISIDQPSVINNRSAWENTINVIDLQGNVTQKTYVDVYIEPGETSGYVTINLLMDGYTDSDTLGVQIVDDLGYANYVGDWQGPAAPTVSDGMVKTLSIYEFNPVEFIANSGTEYVTDFWGPATRYELDFREMPESVGGANGEGITLNLTASSTQVGDVLLQPGYALLGDDAFQYQLPTPAVDPVWTNLFLTRGDDRVDISGDEPVYVVWSPGNDVIDYALRDDDLWDAPNGSLFDGYAYAYFSDGTSGGLDYDYSSGVLEVDAGALGLTTVNNVTEIWDTAYDDTFVGSDGSETFKTIYGGLDTVTGGAGEDKFEIRYYEDRAARIDDGLRYADIQGMIITDYESGELISLQSMGFTAAVDGGDVTGGVSAVYDDVNNVTLISVSNGAVDLQNLVTLSGEFEIDALEYLAQGSPEVGEPNGSMLLYMIDPNLEPIPTLTALGASDTETTSNYNGADYVDLRVLSEGDTYYTLDLGVPDGYDEITTLGDDATGSYGLSGFEGYIVAGSDTSALGTDKTIDIYTSEYANDVVVVAEGGGLSINLGSDLNSQSDVLSFRGNDTAVDITLESTAENNADGDAYITFTTTAGASGATGGLNEVAGADVVLGSEAGDKITGFTNTSNLLSGNAGDDTLTGGIADDLLLGGSGDDTLIGNAGRDVLIDLDGNTDGYLEGGEGKDTYVVRDGAHIKGLGIDDSGALARGSMTSDRYNDRVAFSLSTAAIAAIAAADANISWPPTGTSDVLDYIHLRDLVSLDVQRTDATGQNWELTATINYNDGQSQSAVLGSATFTTDQAYLIDETTGEGATLKTKVLEVDDLLATIHEAVLEQAMYVDEVDADGNPITAADPLSMAAAGQTEGSSAQLLDGSVTLMVGLYAEDAQLVELDPGAPPILLPVIVNGQEVATRFQASAEDEKIVGGRSGDSYEFVPSAFIDDATDEPLADQSFGSDLILERGRRGDMTQRDTLEFAEYTDQAVSNAGTGLSIQDLLVGDLTLLRDEIGTEGSGRSLLVDYFVDGDGDGSHDADAALNETHLGIYKQYYEYSDSFRVEDLQLVDGTGNVTQYDLGVVDSDGNLSTSDGRDAVLLGRAGTDDVFTIVKGSAADQLIEIILDDFEAQRDSIVIEGFGSAVTAPADLVTPEALSETVSVDVTNGPDHRVQMDSGTTDDTTDDVLLDFYFTATVPTVDEFEVVTTTTA